MDEHELRGRRSAAQLLIAPGPGPVAVVRQLLGIQAQELRSARLAIRARTRGTTATEIDRLLAEGSLVVGWLMRGTLHLVDREDYWWLHGLTAPSRLAANGRRLRQEGVSPADAERAVELIERALVEEGPLTRPELVERLAAQGARAEGQAGHHLVMLAALRGVALLGPLRHGRQAFVLARDRLGLPRPVERDAALAELARRYLAGHAPAVPEDLARWAGLPLRDARAGMAAAPVDSALAGAPPPRLLPAFDPYLLGWKDRSFAVSPEHARRVHPGGGVLRPVATVGGMAVGTWTLREGRVQIERFSLLAPGDEEQLAAEAADVVRFASWRSS